MKSRKVLEFCKEPKTRAEIQEFLAIKSRPYLSQKILNPLIEKDLLLLTLPDKLTSKKQKYYTNRK
ncbi:MAG: Fic family protein [Pleomorphochaeta sp.]